jgi:hypothetical protein
LLLRNPGQIQTTYSVKRLVLSMSQFVPVQQSFKSITPHTYITGIYVSVFHRLENQPELSKRLNSLVFHVNEADVCLGKFRVRENSDNNLFITKEFTVYCT